MVYVRRLRAFLTGAQVTLRTPGWRLGIVGTA